MPALLLIPPLIYVTIHYFLDSSGPLSFLLLLEVPLILSILETGMKFQRRSIRRIRSIRLILYSILITGFLLYIVMLPESLYQAWLLLLDAGKPTGMISFAFVYAGGLVSSIGCASLILWKDKLQALLNLLLLCMMVALILYPRGSVFIIFLMILLIKLQLPYEGKIKPAVILSVSFVLFPALAAAFLFPLHNDDPRGSRVVDTFSQRIQSTVYRVYPELPLIFHVPGYGYAYDQVRKTGERPVLSSNIIFKVEAEPGTVFYIRSEVFYSYSRGFWLSEYPGRGIEKSGTPDAAGLRKTILTMETDIYTRILHNSWTGYYEIEGRTVLLDSGGSFEDVSGLPLRRGDQITLYDNPGTAPLPDDAVSAEQLKKAVILPDALKGELGDLAKSLEGESPSASLHNIKKYLSDNFEYTLDTKSSDNMISDFLNSTKKGYCIHFSTAAALLARSLGIPVRMAEGFLVQMPEIDDPVFRTEGNIHSVTGYSAHQWPEIYINEKGWIPWEVTPPFQELGESMMQGNPALDDYTREQLKRMGVFHETGNDTSGSAAGFSIGMNLSLIILPMSALLILTLSILLYPLFHPALLMKRKIRKAEKRYGILPPSSTGWTQWFGSHRTPGSGRCLDLTLKYCYQKDPLDKKEVKELLKLLRQL